MESQAQLQFLSTQQSSANVVPSAGTASPQFANPALMVDQIKYALINSLTYNETLRKQAQDFLTVQCEPIPEFQLTLLKIISEDYTVPGGLVSDNQQLQYQAIMFMKNSLNRLFQLHRNKKMFKMHGPQLTDALKESIKKQLLTLIQAPDGIIHQEKSYEQLTLVASILVHYDFPANWPELNSWLLQMFDDLYSRLSTLSLEQIPAITRFLKFYLEVMSAQNKKKLNTSKGQFHKVAREHLRAVYYVWQFFSENQSNMIYDPKTQQLTLDKFNQELFDLAAKLDKCLQLVIACGFSLHDLMGEPKNNQFVRTTQQLVEKIQFYINCIDKLSTLGPSQHSQKFYELFEKQIKGLLKITTDLQYAEPLIVFDSLGLYIETLAQILFKGHLHNERVKKLAIFALYRIVNFDIYNQIREQGYADNIGLLVSPSKFKNFEPQVQEARSQYQFIFEKPDPKSKDQRLVNRKDGAREILKLVFQFYLPMRENIKSWHSDPESFIEMEDEQYFVSEFDLDSACSLNFLANQLIEKMIYQLYSTLYPFIQDELLGQYFNGQLPMENELIEDALLSMVGMLAKVQQKLPIEKRLDIVSVLDFIHQTKFSNPLFKRRYTHLLTQWVKIIPKVKLMDYFSILVHSLSEINDHVLIYEHCRTIHELVKEIDYWVKKSESGSKPSFAQGQLFESSQTSPISDEEDQIQMSLKINRAIDYTQLFGIVSQKSIPILSIFKAPNLLWNLINYLTLLLEKNSDSLSLMTECFRALNIQHLLQLDSKLIDEAILDMLKNLFALQPASPIILEMCIAILDFKLGKKSDAMVIQFWLFTTRAVCLTNENINNLKALFQKYSYYADAKKDYMAVDFLKIVQEYVVLDLFTTQEEIINIINYMHQKFVAEVSLEAAHIQKISADSQLLDDSGSDEGSEVNNFEKKLNILTVAHLILQKGQANNPEVLTIILTALKDFLMTVCSYFIDFKTHKAQPSSSVFYSYALTFINRTMIINRDFFIQQVLTPLLQAKGIALSQFVESWFGKMDLIVSQESRRINLLAIYTFIPCFSGELIQLKLGEIARLTFTILESYLQMRTLNGGDTRFSSPSKIGNHLAVSTKVKINMMEKVSQRQETLKKEDSLLEVDVLDYFWKQMDYLQQSLSIQPDLLVLSQFIQDEAYRKLYVGLIQAKNQGDQFCVPQEGFASLQQMA